MEIKNITENKKAFLELLLLADEQEDMIDQYLDRGDLFALYDDDLKSVCVVTAEGDGCCELKSLATYEDFHGKGYGTMLVRYVFDHYKGKYRRMTVGTGDIPWILKFYEGCGFVKSHRIENFFTDHYDHPIFDGGIQLVDMVYLTKDL